MQIMMAPNTQLIPAWDDLPAALSFKDKAAWLAAEFAKLPQIDTPIEHRFNETNYERIMRIPKDTLFIGRVHKQGHHVELLEGELVLIVPNGKLHCFAPYAIHTDPGFVTVLYTLTDVIGMTRHPAPTADADVFTVEDTIFEPAQALIQHGEALKQRYLQ